MESTNSTTFKIESVTTAPYDDQNPGTSGLRKKVVHFKQQNYLHNFVQSIFDAHDSKLYVNKSIVLGGDGRYYNEQAINIILNIAAGNKISKVILAENGIMSTPNISLLVREQPKDTCFGAIILTASHNPGGEHEDFGIKFNNSQGAPATEQVTSKMFQLTKQMQSFKTIKSDITFSLKSNSKIELEDKTFFEVVIEPTTELYVKKMQELFNFEKLKTLFERKDFKFVFDCMHGVSGPYALAIFNKILNVPESNLYNCDILPDFGGLHPDPNLVYAKNLVKVMDINGDSGKSLEEVPDFGAACDGDADRNMILGKRFFVSPSDSLAIIVANYKLIANLNRTNGIVGVARSMPTSSALDRVAKKLGIKVKICLIFSYMKHLPDGNFLVI